MVDETIQLRQTTWTVNGTVIGVLQTKERKSYVTNWLYTCMHCGEVWAKESHILTPHRHLGWRTIESYCPLHGKGSLIPPLYVMHNNINMYPKEMWVRDFLLMYDWIVEGGKEYVKETIAQDTGQSTASTD